MHPRHAQGQIRPKISTMPRQKTEAAAYLDIYKLVNEKKRLQQELGILEERRVLIQQRLEVIEQQVAGLEKDAHRLRDHDPAPIAPATIPAKVAPSDNFDTLFLEY
ncbi:MAG: hypothetical protein KME16_06075 [Scytolyngbya sp. HA4215-MV1]|jgi:hypothetical protein|nr:hypothetical protein [Scytolyngbya sp. HA4215-MV1]